VTAGQTHESTRLESVVGRYIGRRRRAGRRRLRPARLAADKGYSVRRIRGWLRERGIEPVIPYKDNQPERHDPCIWFDRAAYRGRAVVEQCVGWLKENRRIGTRYEKLAVNFLAMIQLAMVKRYLRILFSDRA
jgi:transposase